jgi:hypothetical protein
MKKRLLLALALSVAVTACKKEAPKPSAQAAAAAPKLAGKLLGKWNDEESGEIAWEFLSDGKCKAFGEMDCKYEISSESGTVLKLRYSAVESWEDIEVTFGDGDKATWKNLTLEKTEPDSATTKLVRGK